MDLKNFFITVFITLIVVFIPAYALIKTYQIQHNECFIEKAQDYCNENGYTYHLVTNNVLGSGKSFVCLEDQRQQLRTTFKFLPEEIEECSR